jgi:hypothetical protein
MIRCSQIVLALTLLTTAADALPAAERAWIDVNVRVYNAASVPEPDRQRALATAAKLLAPAQLELHFVSCGPPAAEPPCAETVAPDELVLRLVRRAMAPQPAAPLSLGEALLDGRRGGTLATIFVERVEWLAGANQVDPGVLLGRAIAHELVHAWSGRGTHAPHGLMRAVWSGREIADNRPEDWTLRAADLAQLRHSRPVSVRASRISALR